MTSERIGEDAKPAPGDATQEALANRTGWPPGAENAAQAWRDLTGHDAPTTGPSPAPYGGSEKPAGQS